MNRDSSVFVPKIIRRTPSALIAEVQLAYDNKPFAATLNLVVIISDVCASLESDKCRCFLLEPSSNELTASICAKPTNAPRRRRWTICFPRQLR